MNAAYNMDCMEAMWRMPDKRFDLAVVDPPYGVEKAYKATSRIAAYDAGLDFVGFEIDPDYFKAQEQRYTEHTAQMSLFI